MNARKTQGKLIQTGFLHQRWGDDETLESKAKLKIEYWEEEKELEHQYSVFLHLAFWKVLVSLLSRTEIKQGIDHVYLALSSMAPIL